MTYQAVVIQVMIASPGDVEGLTKAAIRILSTASLAEKLVKGGLETAKKFTWDRYISGLIKIYDSISK